VNGLGRAKASLVKSVDELEENLERERKGRADLDKAKRKVEGELKAAHASVEGLEVHKKELEEELRKKDGEISALNGKVEGELKVAHASVERLEVHKKELEEALRKKDGEISALNGKVEDEKVGCVWVCLGAA